MPERILGAAPAEGSGGNVAVGGATEKADAFRLECIDNGTLTQVVYHTGSTASSNTKTVISIFNDGPEGKTPGTLCSGTAEVEVEGTPATNSVITVTGFKVEGLEQGKFYWIAIESVGVGTIKLKEGSTTASARQAEPSKTKKPSEVTKWTAETKGPMYLAGEGDPVGVKPAGVTAITTGLTGQKVQSKNISATQVGIVTQPITTSGEAPKGPLSTTLAVKTGLTGQKVASGGVTTQTTSWPTTIGGNNNQVGSGGNLGIWYYGPPSAQQEEEKHWKEEEPNTYAGIYHGSRTCEIWKATVANAPLVILVHGGGWYGGFFTERSANTKALWEQGVTVINIEYRRNEALNNKTVEEQRRNTFPMEINDVEEAARWAIARAAAFNGNASKVYLIGGSAGAHLVQMAAIGLNKEKANQIKGVVSLSGAYDLLKILEDDINAVEKTQGTWGKDTRRSLGNFAKQASLPITEPAKGLSEEYSPSRKITAATAVSKMLLFNSEGEELTPKDQPTAMKTGAEAAGSVVTYTQVPGTAHSFAYWTTVLPGGKTVVQEIYAFIEASIVAGPIEQPMAVSGTLVGQKVASSAIVTQTTSWPTKVAGSKVASNSITTKTSSWPTALTGRKIASAATSTSLAINTTALNIPFFTGALSGELAVRSGFTGSKTSSAPALASRTSMRSSFAGSKIASNALTSTTGVTSVVLPFVPGPVTPFAAKSSITGMKVASGAVASRVGASSTTTHRKEAQGAIATRIALTVQEHELTALYISFIDPPRAVVDLVQS